MGSFRRSVDILRARRDRGAPATLGEGRCARGRGRLQLSWRKIPGRNAFLTPLQAVKTPGGREMVEALLVHLERSARDADMPLDESVIVDLRKTLGLVQKPLF